MQKKLPNLKKHHPTSLLHNYAQTSYPVVFMCSGMLRMQLGDGLDPDTDPLPDTFRPNHLLESHVSGHMVKREITEEGEVRLVYEDGG
jgi:hypothetical protein